MAQPAAWFENLPKFDTRGLKSLRPSSAGTARKMQIAIDGDRIHRRRAKHIVQHAHDVANAKVHLKTLPKKGWTFHGLMAGSYNGWDLIPAMLELATPATIRQLYVATLGLSRGNAEELITLLDAGTVGAASVICSAYFRSTEGNKQIFELLHTGLTQRGQRCVAVRSHCKLQLLELTDGRHLVVESSANLRSCRCVEQFSITHDAALFAFYRDWMEDVFQKL